MSELMCEIWNPNDSVLDQTKQIVLTPMIDLDCMIIERVKK